MRLRRLACYTSVIGSRPARGHVAGPRRKRYGTVCSRTSAGYPVDCRHIVWREEDSRTDARTGRGCAELPRRNVGQRTAESATASGPATTAAATAAASAKLKRSGAQIRIFDGVPGVWDAVCVLWRSGQFSRAEGHKPRLSSLPAAGRRRATALAASGRAARAADPPR